MKESKNRVVDVAATAQPGKKALASTEAGRHFKNRPGAGFRRFSANHLASPA